MEKNRRFLQFVSTIVSLGLWISNVKCQPCPNNCNSHGRCVFPQTQCECFNGYTGADCSLRTCFMGNAWADIAIGIDNAHNLAECSNNGLCNRDTGECNCRPGYEGNACERKTCPNFCTYVGKCQSMYYYATTKDPGTGVVYSYSQNWDAYQMYGCKCDPTYYGADCSLWTCPTGDDPLTGVGVSTPSNPNQVNEIQQVQHVFQLQILHNSINSSRNLFILSAIIPFLFFLALIAE